MRQCVEIKYLLWKIDLNYSTRSGHGTFECFSLTVIHTWERVESLVKQTCRPTQGKLDHVPKITCIIVDPLLMGYCILSQMRYSNVIAVLWHYEMLPLKNNPKNLC